MAKSWPLALLQVLHTVGIATRAIQERENYREHSNIKLACQSTDGLSATQNRRGAAESLITLRDVQDFPSHFRNAQAKYQGRTCRRQGRLLRFQSNSTATSDGGAQKLGFDLWHVSELIAIQVCSQNSRNKMICLKAALTGRASNFDFKIFEQAAAQNNHLLYY